MNQKNENTAQNEKIYYSKVSLLHSENKDAPLENATFAVSGEISFAEKKQINGKGLVAITLTAVLRDKFVERTFGRDLVAPDHKVQFKFLLSEFDSANFIKYPPRWGQDVIFLLHNMKVESFQRRSGETGHNVSSWCVGYAVLGSTKKTDGSDRPVINIRGLDSTAESNKTSAPAPASTRSSVQEVIGNFTAGDFESDDDLPF